MKFLISLEPDEDGYIVASCPALPGCHSQGKTGEEAIANIKEAIRGYTASMKKHGESVTGIAFEKCGYRSNEQRLMESHAAQLLARPECCGP